MAPAAQYHETLPTITMTMQTQRQTEATAAKDTMESTDIACSTIKPTDSYRSTSTFNWPSTTPKVHATRHFPIPQIQGIIPGMRRALHIEDAAPSLPDSPKSSCDVASQEKSLESATKIPTTLLKSTCPSPRHSAYPRVSPPGFLYPKAIVPHTTVLLQHPNPLRHPDSVARSESRYHSSIMGRVDYELAYLPTAYKLLFVGTLAILVLGFVWTLMMWAVNARMNMESGVKKGRGNGKKGVRNGGEEKRPIDKVSKYVHRHGSESEIRVDGETEPDMDSDSAVTSAAHIPSSRLGNNGHGGEGIEMKYRPHHNRPRSRRLHAEARHRTCTSHRHASSSPPAGPRFNHAPTPTLAVPLSPTPSPLNPFLDPPPTRLPKPDGTHSIGAPMVKRTSLEWKTARAAFFSPHNTTSIPVSRPPVSAALHHTNDSGSASFELNVSDMEALEAGTTPVTGRETPHRHTCSSSSSPGSGGSVRSVGVGLVGKSKSWVDHGIGLVDDAVDVLAARIGRWTDDDGGDEALLLPVARRGKERGREAVG